MTIYDAMQLLSYFVMFSTEAALKEVEKDCNLRPGELLEKKEKMMTQWANL